MDQPVVHADGCPTTSHALSEPLVSRDRHATPASPLLGSKRQTRRIPWARELPTLQHNREVPIMSTVSPPRETTNCFYPSPFCFCSSTTAAGRLLYYPSVASFFFILLHTFEVAGILLRMLVILPRPPITLLSPRLYYHHLAVSRRPRSRSHRAS